MFCGSNKTEEGRFVCRHRVAYTECTVGNHVYHSRYLDILERARGDFFRHLGMPHIKLEKQDVIFPVVECNLRFHAPARYDDVLEIRISARELGRVKHTLQHDVSLRGQPIFSARIVFACTGVDGKPRRLPTELVERMRPYVIQS